MESEAYLTNMLKKQDDILVELRAIRAVVAPAPKAEPVAPPPTPPAKTPDAATPPAPAGSDPSAPATPPKAPKGKGKHVAAK